MLKEGTLILSATSIHIDSKVWKLLTEVKHSDKIPHTFLLTSEAEAEIDGVQAYVLVLYLLFLSFSLFATMCLCEYIDLLCRS